MNCSRHETLRRSFQLALVGWAIALSVPPVVAGGLPAHFVTGYWEDFTNGATVLKLRDVPSGYNVVAVAFASATSTPGQVAFNLDSSLGYSGTAEFISDIADLHSQGRKVILSIGGANGTITVPDSTAASAFASSFVALMNQYGFDGVDIDLEHGITPTALAQGLEAIAAAKPGVIITMAPPTTDMESPSSDYFSLALSIKDILTVVNTQFYNSGTKRGCDGQVYTEGTEDFITAFACIELENGLSPEQVGIGTPASPDAAGGGYLDPTLVVAALDCLRTGSSCGNFKPPTTWPGLRGAMAWSINWDAANGYDWVNTVAAALPSGPCVASATTLCIDNHPGDSRFAVTVSYASSSQSGQGTAIPLKGLGVSEGGLFWFFSGTNPEMLIKIINACDLSQTFWVFYAAATNVGLTTEVTDTTTGMTKSYTNPENHAAAPEQDTSAFACQAGDALAAGAGESPGPSRGGAAPAALDVSAPRAAGLAEPGASSSGLFMSAPFTGAGCSPSSQTLCIDDVPGDRRFAVTVTYRAPTQAGSGTAVSLSSVGVSEGGLFWFFSGTNPEMLVKVINGCSVSNTFWVFESATTNVAFTLTVTDTHTGHQKVYRNAANTAAPPIQDTAALPCP